MKLRPSFMRSEIILVVTTDEGYFLVYEENSGKQIRKVENKLNILKTIEQIETECERYFKKIILNLPLGATSWHKEKLPQMKEKELAKMVRWEKEYWFPEYTEPFVTYSSHYDAENKKTNLMVAATEIDFGFITENNKREIVAVPDEVAMGYALTDIDGCVVFADKDILVTYHNRIPHEIIRLHTETEKEQVRETDLLMQGTETEKTPLSECRVVTNRREVQMTWEENIASPWFIEKMNFDGETPWQVYFFTAFISASCQELKFLLCQRKLIPEFECRQLILQYYRRLILVIPALLFISILYAGNSYFSYCNVNDFYKINEEKRLVLAKYEADNLTMEQMLASLEQRQMARTSWSKYLLIIADSKPEHVYLEAIRQNDETLLLEGVFIDMTALNEWKNYLGQRLNLLTTIKYEQSLPESGEKHFSMTLRKEKDNGFVLGE